MGCAVVMDPIVNIIATETEIICRYQRLIVCRQNKYVSKNYNDLLSRQ